MQCWICHQHSSSILNTLLHWTKMFPSELVWQRKKTVYWKLHEEKSELSLWPSCAVIRSHRPFKKSVRKGLFSLSLTRVDYRPAEVVNFIITYQFVFFLSFYFCFITSPSWISNGSFGHIRVKKHSYTVHFKKIMEQKHFSFCDFFSLQ